MSLLTPEEIRIERLEALARVFQRADRVLAQQNVTCSIDTDGVVNAPAWSSDADITFNATMVGAVSSTDDIIKMTGLNYHELSHVLFTPRLGSMIGVAVQAEGLGNAFNILEDQRIETLLTGWYPSTQPYFLMIIMQYILDSPDTQDMAYILCAGRKYLPADVVAQLRLKYKWQDDLDDIDAVIKEYRLLAYPDDEEYGLELVREFHEILNRHLDQVDDPFGHGSSGRPEVSTSYGGKPLSGDEQSDASAAAEAADDGEEEDDEADGGDEGDDDSDQPGKGGGGVGKADAPITAMTEDELRESIEKEIDAAKSQRPVQEDARNKQRTMVEDLGSDDAIPKLDRAKMPLVSVDVDVQSASQQAAVELQQIRADLDPGWDTHKAYGRVNVGRAMQGADLEEVFDQWNEGVNDAADFEWVICIDLSGSMQGRTHDVSMALWAVKRAIESIDGSVTVFGFNNSSTLLYDRHDKALPNQASSFNAYGGTDPADAIKEAVRIMHRSKRAHKVFAIFSDGEWGEPEFMRKGKPEPSEALIRKMGENGVRTVSGFFMPHGSRRGGKTPEQLFAESKHECQIHLRIDHTKDVIGMCRDITASLMF